MYGWLEVDIVIYLWIVFYVFFIWIYCVVSYNVGKRRICCFKVVNILIMRVSVGIINFVYLVWVVLVV